MFYPQEKTMTEKHGYVGRAVAGVFTQLCVVCIHIGRARYKLPDTPVLI
jgi:hypothetical protein